MSFSSNRYTLLHHQSKIKKANTPITLSEKIIVGLNASIGAIGVTSFLRLII